MRNLILAAALLLGACSTTSESTQAVMSDPRVKVAMACEGYATAARAAAAAINADKISAEGVQRILAIRNTVGSRCTNQANETPDTLLTAATDAAVQITAIIGSK